MKEKSRFVENGVTFYERCKTCTSPFRDEVYAKYVNEKESIKKIFEDISLRGYKGTIDTLSRHVINHIGTRKQLELRAVTSVDETTLQAMIESDKLPKISKEDFLYDIIAVARTKVKSATVRDGLMAAKELREIESKRKESFFDDMAQAVVKKKIKISRVTETIEEQPIIEVHAQEVQNP